MQKEIILQSSNDLEHYTGIKLVPNDVQAYKIALKTPYDLTGASFKVTAKRADGATIEGMGTCIDNTAYYTLANNMYSQGKEVHIRLTLFSAIGSVLTEKELIFDIAEDWGESDISGDNRVPALDTLIIQVTDGLNQVNNAMGEITGAINEVNDVLEAVDEIDWDKISDLDNKLDKTNIANRVYATDATGNQVAQPTGFFASGATIKIAASNAMAKSKVSADYVCSGASDEVIFNSAVNALPSYGGSIELSEGNFIFSDYFEISKGNVFIKGQGHSTNIINDEPTQVYAWVSNTHIKDCRVGYLFIEGGGTFENCHFGSADFGGDTTLKNCYSTGEIKIYNGVAILMGNRLNTLSRTLTGTILPPTAEEIRKLNIIETITGL